MAKRTSITIEGFTEGWISDYANMINTPLDGQEGQYGYSFGVSAVRPGYKGQLAPTEILNGASFSNTAFTSLPRAVATNFAYTTTRSAIMTGGLSGTAPRIHICDSSNVETSHHDITASAGANFTSLPTTGYWGDDIIFYPAYADSVGTYADFAFYSWNDSNYGHVGRYTYGSTTYSDDFMSTAPVGASASGFTKAVPHRMCVGPDKLLYITNGQFIAQYDSTSDQSGASGTVNYQALDLGAGWMAVDVQPFQTYVAIAAVRMGTTYQSVTFACESRVILWDGFSLDFNQVYGTDDWTIGSLFVRNGLLYAFTQGLNGTTKVKVLPPNPPIFTTVFEAPTLVVGNAPLPNQVEYFNGMLMWAGDTTTNMIFGLMQTATGFAFHTPYFINDGSHTTIKTGLLKNINSNYLFAGVNSGSYAMLGVIGDGASNGSIVSSAIGAQIVQAHTRVIEIPYKTTIKKVLAHFSQFGADSSCYLSLVPNYTHLVEDGSGNPTGDLLGWAINTTNHPNIATTLTASLSEIGKNITATDLTRFWMNYKITNTSTSATPPILKKIEIIIEEVENP